MDKKILEELKEKAKEIRKSILIMTTNAGSGHPGGSMSATDLIVYLYYKKLKHDSKNPNWEKRDRFVLSKGHCCPLIYAILADQGYFPKEALNTLRKRGTILQGHASRMDTPGVEASTGSLGQGLSIGNGMALAFKLDKKPNRVYVLVGDGESQEGQVWEAAMTAAHYDLDNVTLIYDFNGLQIDGYVKEIMNVEPIEKKWQAFGWHTVTINGHDFDEIEKAFDEAETREELCSSVSRKPPVSMKTKDKPTVIIAKTIKGKGVSFMENKVEYHGKPLTKEQLQEALKELL